MSLIAGITGPVAGKTSDKLLINIGGLTMAVATPLPTLAQAPLSEVITLHAHLVVREDDLALYGFTTAEERDLFVRLLGVSGVGAKVGMALLSTHSVDALCAAIINGDMQRLTRTPGVGLKLAQRLSLELKTSLTKFLANLPPSIHADGPARETIIGAATNESDVTDALTGLGYSAAEVQSALRTIPDASATPLDALIMKVLRILAH